LWDWDSSCRRGTRFPVSVRRRCTKYRTAVLLLGFRLMPARHAVSRFSPSAVHEISHCGAVVGLPPHAGEALTFARTKVSKMRYMPLQPRALTATGDTGHTPLCGHPDLLRKSCSRAPITNWTSCETLQRSLQPRALAQRVTRGIRPSAVTLICFANPAHVPRLRVGLRAKHYSTVCSLGH